VIASEFMEAGRSILRGIVTPERTTLIASNHRSFAIGEKIARAMASRTGCRRRRDRDCGEEGNHLRYGCAGRQEWQHHFGRHVRRVGGADVLPFGLDSYLM